ncbi:HipA family kinase [Photobacterium phosphoreum]|uniref:HipA family kinase n=1 Tax=Photobacterium phosphoreum TaxID=659 RepID=UPI0027B9CABE|nr:HipA family kinase [Photobacterium phosphoreum]
MVYIERIIRKMKQGQTGPYLCVGDNGNQYIVKGPNTTYRGLINEWVCGQLGKALGIPIPDFEIAYIDESLIEFGTYELTEGDWFASKYEDNIQDVPFHLLSKLDTEKLKLLFVFDYWIKNGDRNLTEHGGNPNLFICSDLCSFVVLDHNLAFDKEHDQIFESLKFIHVASIAWFAEQKNLFDKEYYENRLEDVMKELDSILESVPEEWLDNCGDDGILEEIRTTLSRFRLPEFWEGIK